MKLHVTPALLVTCLATLVAPAASAALLFSDNFDATANVTPNDQITNPGRQGGPLATLGYIVAGNSQIGNTGTLAPYGGGSPGDELLVAFGGGGRINYNFSGVGAPLEITFNGLPEFNGGTDNWIALTIADQGAGTFITDAGVDGGVLFRANGATELWGDGANSGAGGTGTATGLNTWSSYKVVISDTAGTGSAFTGNGSVMAYYQNNVLLGTHTLNQLGATDGYIGFVGANIAGVDNVVISTIPEPGAALLIPAALGFLARRRRRSQK